MKTIDEQILEWEPMIHFVVCHFNIHPNEQDDCVQIARNIIVSIETRLYAIENVLLPVHPQGDPEPSTKEMHDT